jgi:cbb3-type cytochrome c oxidase subunit III
LLRIVSAAAIGVAVAFLLAACGTGGRATGSGDKENGRKLFQEKCAGCHTLEAAGSTATVGPNLDAAFAQARADGYKESAILEVVHQQILYPGQFDTKTSNPNYLVANMPEKLVTGKNAVDVAAFVAANAGVNGFTQPVEVTGTNGKKIFVAKCGSCHTLKDAATTGTVGPNLDLLKPPFATVQTQVINGGGAMPAFKGTLTSAQIKAVAQYVSQVAGK